MSLLQETIVFILIVPLLLQIILPLVMLLVHLVSFPVRSIFSAKRGQTQLESAKFSSVEHPA